MTMAKSMPEMEDYKYGFRDEHKAVFESGKGLTEEIVRTIVAAGYQNACVVGHAKAGTPHVSVVA